MIESWLTSEFAVRMNDLGVFKDRTRSPEGRGFRLKLHDLDPSAPLSPFYLDFRLLQSDFQAKNKAVGMFSQMIATELSFRPAQLAPVPEAIVPVVSSLSDFLNIPMVTPRGAKSHGSGAKVDGIWTPGMTAVLFDDVVTSAKSILDATQVMRGVGFKIEHVFVLVDRQQGGREQLEAQGLTLHAALTLDGLLNLYKQFGLLSDQQLGEITEYRQFLRTLSK